MKDFWNNRYRNSEYAYGIKPNEYFKEKLNNLKVGKILLPAEGEGRNAVYAAKLGWVVTAFDISEEGKIKAEHLAKINNVKINYQLGDLNELILDVNEYDVIGLIYAHFPANLKFNYHQKLSTYIKSGGVVILEAFSKSNIINNNEDSGFNGPKDIEMLFSTEELISYFIDFEIVELNQIVVDLDEGEYHNGKNSIIRYLGIKN